MNGWRFIESIGMWINLDRLLKLSIEGEGNDWQVQAGTNSDDILVLGNFESEPDAMKFAKKLVRGGDDRY